MYRIINSLATAEFNKKISAVEVNFLGYGDVSQYQESLDIATNIALMYDTKRWLFNKKHYDDISEKQFLMYMQSWYQRFSQYFTDTLDTCCTVVLLTSVASSAVFRNLQTGQTDGRMQGLELKVFTTKDEVNDFFIGESNKMLSL